MSRSKTRGARTTVKTILYENSDGGAEFINFINELKESGDVIFNDFVRNALRHYYYHLQYSHSAADIAKYFHDSSLINNQTSASSQGDFDERQSSPTLAPNIGASDIVDAPKSVISEPDMAAHNQVEDKSVDLPGQVDSVKDEDVDEEYSDEHTVSLDDGLEALLALDDDDIP